MVKEYIEREAAILAVCSARLPDKTADGTPIANGKRSVVDCIQRIKAIPAVNKCLEWISVNDRLPELHDEEFLDEVTGESVRYKESKPVLIWLGKGGFMDIGIYEKSDAIDDFCYQGVQATVTYWMPLPEPPKEATDGAP